MPLPAALRDALSPVFRARVSIGAAVVRGELYAGHARDLDRAFPICIAVDRRVGMVNDEFPVMPSEVSPANDAARELCAAINNPKV